MDQNDYHSAFSGLVVMISFVKCQICKNIYVENVENYLLVDVGSFGNLDN
jgi:hypothetical protein